MEIKKSMATYSYEYNREIQLVLVSYQLEGILGNANNAGGETRVLLSPPAREGDRIKISIPEGCKEVILDIL